MLIVAIASALTVPSTDVAVAVPVMTLSASTTAVVPTVKAPLAPSRMSRPTALFNSASALTVELTPKVPVLLAVALRSTWASALTLALVPKVMSASELRPRTSICWDVTRPELVLVAEVSTLPADALTFRPVTDDAMASTSAVPAAVTDALVPKLTSEIAPATFKPATKSAPALATAVGSLPVPWLPMFVAVALRSTAP